jgi:hypothetical protein
LRLTWREYPRRVRSCRTCWHKPSGTNRVVQAPQSRGQLLAAFRNPQQRARRTPSLACSRSPMVTGSTNQRKSSSNRWIRLARCLPAGPLAAHSVRGRWGCQKILDPANHPTVRVARDTAAVPP